MLISSLLITTNQHTETAEQTKVLYDYIISSPAIFNKIQNITLNNDLSSDHSVIIFDFSTNLNIKVKLYHKADWDTINSSLSKHLTILQEQTLNLISLITLILLTLTIMQPPFLLTLF